MMEQPTLEKEEKEPSSPPPSERPEVIGDIPAEKEAVGEGDKEKFSPFREYTELMVQLADDGLPSAERTERLKELSIKEAELVGAGLIPPEKLPAGVRWGMADETLENAIAALEERSPEPLAEETRLQVAGRLRDKEPLTPGEETLLAELKRTQAERELFKTLVWESKEAKATVAPEVEKPKEIAGEAEDVWRASNLLRNPREVKSRFEEAEVEQDLRAAVRSSVLDEATEYVAAHPELVTSSRFENDPAGMATQIAEGATTLENIPTLGSVLFLSAQGAGLDREEAVRFTAEALAHGHLQGIKKTDRQDHSLEKPLRLAQGLLGHYQNPAWLDRYGRAAGKDLYGAVKEYATVSKE